MNKKLITKVLLNSFFGIVIWAIIDFVICLIKKQSFVDTFFTVQNIIEIIAIYTGCSLGYYWSQSKKNNK